MFNGSCSTEIVLEHSIYTLMLSMIAINTRNVMCIIVLRWNQYVILHR